jgi:hypothetical protein
MTQVRKWVYCEGTTGSNALAVQTGNLTLYYSYQTVIAFRSPEKGLVVSENVWSRTTGKHLNAISGDRIEYSEFHKQLSEVLKFHGLEV